MASMDPADLETVMAVTRAFLEELSASGALVFAGGLHPPSTAVTVDHLTPDQEAAVAWAAKSSKALGTRIEVRAFQEVPA